MTLIIGALCNDGIIIGSDGATTLNTTLGQLTARLPTKKLTTIDSKLIVGISGPVGLIQRVTNRIENLWKSNQFANKDKIQSAEIIRNSIVDPIAEEFKISTKFGALGQSAFNSSLCHSLVAGVFKKELSLIQFFEKGDPELATAQVPFICIGSGQSLADPFLAFLKRIFWSATSINLSDGTFAVLWALKHSINVSPGGVSEPIQLMQLTYSNSTVSIVEIERNQVREIEESIQRAEDSLKNFRNFFTDQTSAEIPPQP